MRLTLRTLLAWLDDTLPATEVRDIGKQVAESPYRTGAGRSHPSCDSPAAAHGTRQDGAGRAPIPTWWPGYVDNDLEPDQVAEYEKKCLTSDVNLAEAASVHQILSLLGQKVHVPGEAKARMYQLVKGREAISPRRTDGAKPRPRAGHQADPAVGCPRASATALAGTLRARRRMPRASSQS